MEEARNSERLNLRLTPELLEAARSEAARRSLTLSDWLRGLIVEASGGPLLPSTGKRTAKRGRKRTRRQS
jgi:hypothetical protein